MKSQKVINTPSPLRGEGQGEGEESGNFKNLIGRIFSQITTDDDLVKSRQNDGFDVGATRRVARSRAAWRAAPTFRNDEVEAQSRSERETFYEITNIDELVKSQRAKMGSKFS